LAFRQPKSQDIAITALNGKPFRPDPDLKCCPADLGLARGTVARAYRELAAEGVVASRGWHGTTVLARPQPTDEERAARLDDAARLYALTARAMGVDPARALRVVRAALGDESGGSTVITD
jgi:DNA-binding transcriptional regulator YhcF (GntR family)